MEPEILEDEDLGLNFDFVEIDYKELEFLDGHQGWHSGTFEEINFNISDDWLD